MNLVEKFLIEYVDVLAFCLLPNHFYLVIKVKDEILIKRGQDKGTVLLKENGSILKDEEEIGRFVSNQLKRMLYYLIQMAFNKTCKYMISIAILYEGASFKYNTYSRLLFTTVTSKMEKAIIYSHF